MFRNKAATFMLISQCFFFSPVAFGRKQSLGMLTTRGGADVRNSASAVLSCVQSQEARGLYSSEFHGPRSDVFFFFLTGKLSVGFFERNFKCFHNLRINPGAGMVSFCIRACVVNRQYHRV